MTSDFNAVRGWRKWSFLAAGVLGLLPLPGRAQEEPPPPPSRPGNVIFLLGNNESMQDFPEYLPEVNGTVVSGPTGTTPGSFGVDGPAGLAVGTGCSDPELVAAMSWFDKDSPEPARNGSIPYDSDPDFGAEPQFFNPNRFYQSRGSRVAWVVEEYPYSLSWDFRMTDGNSDTLNACFRAFNWDWAYWNSPVAEQCLSCLATKGWWRGPITTNIARQGPQERPGLPPRSVEAKRKWVLSGRVLNVRPPKFVTMRKVLKDVIATAPPRRMGLATFGPDQGWFDPPQLLRPLKPTCDQVYPNLDEAQLNRAELQRAVNNIVFRNNERSVGEALFGLGGYFSSQRVDNRWSSWFAPPLMPGFGWPGCCNGGTYLNPYTGQDGSTWGYASDEWLKSAQPFELGGADRSVCFDNQPSSVIVMTDGTPYSDNTVPITRMMELLKANGARHPDGILLTFDPSNPESNTVPGGVNYCDQFARTGYGDRYMKEDCDYTHYNWPTGLARTNRNFMDDVAFFLANMDLRDDLPGQQSVRTYTIGFRDHSPMLQSIAMAGRGQFFFANHPAELRDSLQDILGAPVTARQR